nr:hypothetical protein [Streptomyces sp. ISL-112]
MAIGKRVHVATGTAEVIVTLTPGGAVVARHPRSWARHQTITDPDHARTAAALRGEYRHHVASQAIRSRAQAAAHPDFVEVEQLTCSPARRHRRARR